MFRVGITGGIGSGKTTVSAIFKLLGIPVYYADDAAKKLMQEDKKLVSQIINHFGAKSYKDGQLDRQYISSIVFNDSEQLRQLNDLVHPATIRDAMNWMNAQSTPYAIKEAALIFESGSQDQLDYIIGVYAPEPLRILRAMKRDKVKRESIQARLKKQIDESLKMRLCDTIILNDEQHLVIPQVLQLHKKLLKLAEEKNFTAVGR